MQKDNFVTYLEQHKKEAYFLISAPGNSGDILLRKGLKLYLKNNTYDIVDEVEMAQTILIHGGGNIDDVWGVGIELFKHISKNYPHKKIIVAPSTCHFSKTNFEKILNSCTQEIHFFAREKYSLKRLRNMNLNSNVRTYLSNDTAFLLEGTPYLKALKKKVSEDYTLFSFRTDKESRWLPLEACPHKSGQFERIKNKYVHWLRRRFIKKQCKEAYGRKEKVIVDASYEDFGTFIDLILRAREIYTDRLHVGILGAMLGKKVYLYKTKYNKVEGVYEQTLHKYPNVHVEV